MKKFKIVWSILVVLYISLALTLIMLFSEKKQPREVSFEHDITSSIDSIIGRRSMTVMSITDSGVFPITYHSGDTSYESFEHGEYAAMTTSAYPFLSWTKSGDTLYAHSEYEDDTSVYNWGSTMSVAPHWGKYKSYRITEFICCWDSCEGEYILRTFPLDSLINNEEFISLISDSTKIGINFFYSTTDNLGR